MRFLFNLWRDNISFFDVKVDFFTRFCRKNVVFSSIIGRAGVIVRSLNKTDIMFILHSAIGILSANAVFLIIPLFYHQFDVSKLNFWAHALVFVASILSVIYNFRQYRKNSCDSDEENNT